MTGCGIGAGYLAAKTEDQGRGLFAAFALLFLVMAFAGFRPRPAGADEAGLPAGSRFAPHRLMLLAMILLGVVLLAGGWQLLRDRF